MAADKAFCNEGRSGREAQRYAHRQAAEARRKEKGQEPQEGTGEPPLRIGARQ